MKARSIRVGSVMVSAVFALAAVLARPAAVWAQDIDQWYVVSMGDQRVGWMRMAEKDVGRGIESTSEVQLEIARGETTLAIHLKNVFLETYAGYPFELESSQALGSKPVVRKYRYEKEKIVATISQDGDSQIQTFPGAPLEWLTPAASRRFVAAQIAEGVEEFSYTMIDPTGGVGPVHVTSTVVGPTIVEAVGKRLPAVEVRTEQSMAPGVITTEFLAENGMPIRTELAIGSMSLTVLLSEREVATAKVDPAEIMVSTLVTPSRAISNPRAVKSASYVLSVNAGRLGDVPSVGAQRAERLDDRRVRVVVDAKQSEAVDVSVARDPRYMEGSSMLNWRDEQIGELATRAVNRNFNQAPEAMAEALRRFVHSHISTKSLEVGLASASEVARTREGDCTEHATLLAAALRFCGIPSRVVSGLIYAEEFAGRSRIFGYHMWTQALLPDASGGMRWVDLDATLPIGTPFDATHIALSTSAMSDSETINSMAALAPLLGRLNIEVESTVYPTGRRE